ncbi:MAG: hypothetical protein CHACPFDD_03954 [Phycisphaerae bacterium]|nr:hypothetical protein [Phycisphaerae bacterium]
MKKRSINNWAGGCIAVAAFFVLPARSWQSAPPPQTVPPPSPRAALSPDATLSRVAFGSCARQDRPQPIWDAIGHDRPELFLMIGDNIYGDSDDMNVLRAKYAQLEAVEGFRRLTESCPLLATWDDHDYGKNDAGADFAMRAESQQAFLDFLRVAPTSPRRTREGVYDAVAVGPAGRRVQIILLDTRYFRSPLKRGDPAPAGSGRPGPYAADDDPAATILGEAQWRWLDEQLRTDADVRIVASSIQLVAGEQQYEKWMNFPREWARLYGLIRARGAKGVIVISGDRHSAELSCHRPAARPAGADDEPPYPIYDLTSSALNQNRGWQNEVNPHRIGAVYFEPNYGLISIDWTTADAALTLEIRSVEGKPLIRHDLRLSELR